MTLSSPCLSTDVIHDTRFALFKHWPNSFSLVFQNEVGLTDEPLTQHMTHSDEFSPCVRKQGCSDWRTADTTRDAEWHIFPMCSETRSVCLTDRWRYTWFTVKYFHKGSETRPLSFLIQHMALILTYFTGVRQRVQSDSSWCGCDWRRPVCR